MIAYTADQLRSFNRGEGPPPRSVRKAIFSLQLWRPKRFWPVDQHKQSSGIRLGLLNVQSVTERSVAVSDVIASRQLDVFALTETWHQASDDLPLKRSAPPGYSIIAAARCEARPSASTTRGGGVALIHSNRFAAKRITLDINPTTFEVLCCSLRSASTSVVYVVVYRPGSESVSDQFFEELTTLLEIVATFRRQVIVAGDFNIHVNDPADRHAVRLSELLASLDLQQVVKQPTHGDVRNGNTLDLVITRSDGLPSSCTVDPPNMISDHGLVVCQFPTIPFAVRWVERTCRPWRKVNREAFNNSLRSSVLCACRDKTRQMTASELFDVYDGTLRQIADTHAPASTSVRQIRRLSPWFDYDCRQARRKSRLLERRYRRSNSDPDRTAWVIQVRAMHTLYKQKENAYWSRHIADNAGNPKKLWRSLASILKRDKDTSPPIPSLTAQQLSDYFVDKIDAVRAATEDADAPSFTPYAGKQLTSFRELSEEEIRKLLLKSPPKTCSLDPLPTDVLLESIDILLPFICAMCNASLREGVLPSSQKTAIITPVVKKSGLDPDEPQSYRPISNLTFISKVIERIVAEQMRGHLTECDLMPPVQSAYRRGHSTETALMKVIADIIDAADNQKVTLLGLLDMSAAFDTVDHLILLRRLQISYGISGQVLQWLTSFLTDRTQVVAFAGAQSTLQSLMCGVPQGSVLGPLLFVLYSADVMKIAASHRVCFHAYADDMQTYASCTAPDQQMATSRLLTCIADIEKWMSSNRLKLNADKTEFIWFGTRQQLAKLRSVPLLMKGQLIAPLDKVRDLGVILDSELSMDAHARNVVRSCFYQLRQLRSVRKSLPTDARRTLAVGFIASRADYCNGVLHGVSAQVIRRLQMVLNAAARLVVGAGKFDHITPVLRDVLHWLPVRQRILFKVAVTAFDCIRGTGPAYFQHVCEPVADICGRTHLRSAKRHDMVVPRTRTQLGQRSFHVAAPVVWNSLPTQLRSTSISRGQFRRGLKTHLFTQAYT